MPRYETLVMIAADSLQTLRACDVYRVLSEAPAADRNGRECEPCYAYFDETVRAAKYEAAKLPTDEQYLAALGPCGR